MDEFAEGFCVFVVILALLIWGSVSITSCSKSVAGEQRTVSFLRKYTEPKLKVVSDEPQVYIFDNDSDFFKIVEGKKYKVWVRHLKSNPMYIYDVGEEVK